MSKVVIDTSIIIDHLRGISETFKNLEKQQQEGTIELLIPTIVIVELFTGKDAGKKKARDAMDDLLRGLSVAELTPSAARKAGELIRTYLQVPDPFDVIIAAIALEQNASIATYNDKHFKRIRGIKIFPIP